MEDFKKYAEIRGYKGKCLNDVLEILKNKGFLMVRDHSLNAEEEVWIVCGLSEKIQ